VSQFYRTVGFYRILTVGSDQISTLGGPNVIPFPELLCDFIKFHKIPIRFDYRIESSQGIIDLLKEPFFWQN